MTLWAVLAGTELVDVLDDTAPTCSGGWPPPCGGCTACLFAQADYSNCTVIPVPTDASRYETFSDALGPILSEKNPSIPRRN